LGAPSPCALTPDDDSDDNHLYYIRRYKLREVPVPLDNDGDLFENEDWVDGVDNDGDGLVDEDPEDYQPLRGASEGFIRLYNPDLQKVGEWTIPSLLCVEHDANDGLMTSTEGLQHSVLVKVPIALMDKAGEYRFVISAKDSHADREKGHRNKWALERNSITKIPSFALIALDETRLVPPKTINDAPHAHTARGFLMRQIWNSADRKWQQGYKPWQPEGQPRTGGSGLIINEHARYVLHTLKRRHDPANEPRKWAHGNAIWGFFGHANPLVLQMPGGGLLTNLHNYKQISGTPHEVYDISGMNMSWIRLAFIKGCSTAGNHIYDTTRADVCSRYCSPGHCTSEKSIAYTFFQNGADCVVGFKGSQYAGPTFRQFNYSFWYYLQYRGWTVRQALKEAKDDLGFMYLLRKKDDPYFAVTERLMVWGDTTLAPPGYGQ
jgi:hypothetical protein